MNIHLKINVLSLAAGHYFFCKKSNQKNFDFLMLAAAVVTAYVTLTVLMVVMVTVHIRIKGKAV